MTIEALQEIIKQGFEQTKQGFEQINARLDRIDTRLDDVEARLRKVETDVAEIKGRRLAFKEWIPIGCAVIAVIVSIIALAR